MHCGCCNPGVCASFPRVPGMGFDGSATAACPCPFRAVTDTGPGDVCVVCVHIVAAVTESYLLARSHRFSHDHCHFPSLVCARHLLTNQTLFNFFLTTTLTM